MVKSSTRLGNEYTPTLVNGYLSGEARIKSKAEADGYSIEKMIEALF